MLNEVRELFSHTRDVNRDGFTVVNVTLTDVFCKLTANHWTRIPVVAQFEDDRYIHNNQTELSVYYLPLLREALIAISPNVQSC